MSKNIENLKDWFIFFIAVISCVVGIVFWIQTVNDADFVRIENDIESLRDDIDSIRENNNEILRIVGRLEGKIDK